MEYLQRVYQWTIKRHEKAVGCKDGRIAYIVEYSLDNEVVSAALSAGADGWCDRVREARHALRESAVEAQHKAAEINQARMRGGAGHG